MAMGAFDDFPEEAVPLIEVSDDKQTLQVSEAAAALFSKIDCAICPIAVVGLYRTGKSSLLNFLNGKQIGFRVGPSVSRCTRGVWIYGRPQEVTLADGSRCAVLLLDTEGVGGLEADSQYDTRIFALSCLMCASLVYNSLGSIDENAIGQLSFVAQLSKHIRFSPPPDPSLAEPQPGDATGDGARRLRDAAARSAAEADEDAAALCQFMPSFTWVLRDFALELCDERGDAITADEYLESALRPQKGYEAAVLERNRVRSMLTAFFSRRGCAALVRPINDEAKLQQIDELPPRELRPEFRAGVADLRDSLFAPENVRPKTIRGARLNGSTYLELLRQYVDAVNGGGVPVISSAWDHVASAECAAAQSAASDLYDSSMAAVEAPGGVFEADALAQHCARAEAAAVAAFDARAVGDAAPERRADLLSSLARSRATFEAANRAKSARLCSKFLAKLYMDVVWAALARISADDGDGATPIDLASDLEAAWAELRFKFNAKAKGPAKDEQLLAFTAEKWPESTHELVRRLETRHDTVDRLERERLLRVQHELAEKDGASEARQHILYDAQAALIGAQSEKARFEARAAAAQKQLKEAQRGRAEDKEAAEAALHDVQLQLQRLQNKVDAENENGAGKKLDGNRAAQQADGANGAENEPKPVKAGCQCVVA
ncbi:guanylate-binding protein [Pelagophyceae sp. CCMP2097]|nr:guanylate-binding protein [Pelagophyceae sp. CCMP2097]